MCKIIESRARFLSSNQHQILHCKRMHNHAKTEVLPDDISTPRKSSLAFFIIFRKQIAPQIRINKVPTSIFSFIVATPS